MAFAPEAEITFEAAPEPQASLEDAFAKDPFAKAAVPSLPPPSAAPRKPARAAAPARALPALDKKPAGGLDDAFAATFAADTEFALSDTAPGDAASASARPTAAKPPAAKPAATKPAPAASKPVAAKDEDAFDRGFDATFDSAFSEPPQASKPPAKLGAANVALDLMPPPLPPPPPGMDEVAARAFGLGATMMQPAPSFDAATLPGNHEPGADDGFGLAAPTAVDDDEPEMTLEPAAQSLPQSPSDRRARAGPRSRR